MPATPAPPPAPAAGPAGALTVLTAMDTELAPLARRLALRKGRLGGVACAPAPPARPSPRWWRR